MLSTATHDTRALDPKTLRPSTPITKWLGPLSACDAPSAASRRSEPETHSTPPPAANRDRAAADDSATARGHTHTHTSRAVAAADGERLTWSGYANHHERGQTRQRTELNAAIHETGSRKPGYSGIRSFLVVFDAATIFEIENARGDGARRARDRSRGLTDVRVC